MTQNVWSEQLSSHLLNLQALTESTSDVDLSFKLHVSTFCKFKSEADYVI